MIGERAVAALTVAAVLTLVIARPVLMFPAMLAAMLLRRGGHHHSH